MPQTERKELLTTRGILSSNKKNRETKLIENLICASLNGAELFPFGSGICASVVLMRFSEQ
jgi:hypothetical protein